MINQYWYLYFIERKLRNFLNKQGANAMLFKIGNSIVQAYVSDQGFFFIINDIIVIPEFDAESCFVLINGSRLNVTYL